MKTKHRIIGLVILVALAVIIVPLFFSRSGSSDKTAIAPSNVSTASGQPEIQQIAIPTQQNATSPTAKPASTAPSADLATQPLQATADNGQSNTPDNNANTSAANPQTAAGDNNTQATVAEQNTVAAENEVEPAATAQPTTAQASTTQASSSQATNVAPAASDNTTTANATTLAAAPASAKSNVTPASNSSSASDNSNSTEEAAPPTEKGTPKTPIPRNKNGAVKHKYAAEEESAVVAKKHESHEVTAAKAKAAELANAWSVQLGSFSQKENAEKLVKELRSKGYAAYMHQAKSGKGSISRVYVGPELKREKAEAMATKLLETLNLKGVVVKYDV